EFDVTARALRFYEDQGLIAPEPRACPHLFAARQGAAGVDIAGKTGGFQSF
ncbi:MerR family DNA-binding transcriptional regulator, partial [Streptococcus pneumoniae]|uniref:MerR family DNA-binding transcriptional regulator n=1 Tax=Streptococcus pneumoniae TaxID=1313 RepID=UPI0039B6FBFD